MKMNEMKMERTEHKTQWLKAEQSMHYKIGSTRKYKVNIFILGNWMPRWTVNKDT